MLGGRGSETSRDQALEHLVMEAEADAALILSDAYARSIAAGTLECGASTLKRLVKNIGDNLETYTLFRNERYHSVVVDLLEATMPVWLRRELWNDEIGEEVRGFMKRWLGPVVERCDGSWRTRSRFLQLLEAYLAADSTESFWFFNPAAGDSSMEVDEPEVSPTALSRTALFDADVRVRYMTGHICAKSLMYLTMAGVPTLPIYHELSQSLPSEMDE